MINRSALLVTPKEPYFQWAEQLPGGGPSARDRTERVVFLVPEIVDPRHAKEIIKGASRIIFEHELWAWHMEPADWPKKRNYKTFLEWFDVEVNSPVMDLCDYDIEEDESIE